MHAIESDFFCMARARDQTHPRSLQQAENERLSYKCSSNTPDITRSLVGFARPTDGTKARVIIRSARRFLIRSSLNRNSGSKRADLATAEPGQFLHDLLSLAHGDCRWFSSFVSYSAGIVLNLEVPNPTPEADPASAFAMPAIFATTHWSVVLAAGHSSVPGAHEALEQL